MRWVDIAWSINDQGDGGQARGNPNGLATLGRTPKISDLHITCVPEEHRTSEQVSSDLMHRHIRCNGHLQPGLWSGVH